MAEATGYPKKRARTRQRLLRAGMEALADTGPDSVTIAQVAAIAGTAPGTFYNHFSSVSELVDEIAESLGSGVEIAVDALEVVEHDPAARVAIGTLQLLQLAEHDQVASAAFVSLVAVMPEFRARVRGIVGRAIEDGVENGRFDVESGAAPLNAVLGTSLQSMRSRALGEATVLDQPRVASLVLRVLGVPQDNIPTVVDRAREIVAAAPLPTAS